MFDGQNNPNYRVRSFTSFPGTKLHTKPNQVDPYFDPIDDTPPSNGKEAGYTLCDDRESLYIHVTDKDGNNVQNYNIIIDNTNYGKTDASGILKVTLWNASVDTKHMINGCQCFTTTGACNQQKIDIVLKESTKPSCTNLAIDCL
jgi:hypothetical protein